MTRSTLLLMSLVSLVTVAAACSTEDKGATRRVRRGQIAGRPATDPETGEALPDFNDPRTAEKEGLPDPFETLLKGTDQNAALCARAGVMDDTNPNFNAMTNALCKEKRTINSIRDLQTALGLDFKQRGANATNGSNGNPGFAFLANSSSLVARSVSAMNPRAFIFSGPPGQPVRIPGYVVMTFVRGEEFVEIAAESPKAGNKLSLYLLRFDLACGHDCKNADLLTPAIESNWAGITVYDDEDLKNSLLDCRHCHQPEGPTTKLMLRMQELKDPWTHWFRNDKPGGVTLLKDYFRAHGTEEDYAGVPGVIIGKSDGRALEDLVVGQGFDKQPNQFDTVAIEKEITQSNGDQPEVNTTPGKSATWQAIFDRAFQGDFIPVPYHDVKVTDPDKLQFVTDEYKKFMSGQTPELVDTRRVFLDDALEDMAMIPKKGATGKEVLVQTCQQCHHPKLDQTISRAKFDVTQLDTMSREEKQLAIARLKMGSANRLRMPPSSMRSIPDDARKAAIEYLNQ